MPYFCSELSGSESRCEEVVIGSAMLRWRNHTPFETRPARRLRRRDVLGKAFVEPHDLSVVSKMTFEPQIDGSVLGAQLAVLGMSCGLAAYWWLVVVPSERATLAREKRKGDVGVYLEVGL